MILREILLAMEAVIRVPFMEVDMVANQVTDLEVDKEETNMVAKIPHEHSYDSCN